MVGGAALFAGMFVIVLINGRWPAFLEPVRSRFALASDLLGNFAFIVELGVFVGPGFLVAWLGERMGSYARGIKLLAIAMASVVLATASILTIWLAAPNPPISERAAQSLTFDDAEAQLHVRQAASSLGEMVRKVEAVRRALEAERQRVVQTDSERDLNGATTKALEQELQSAEIRQREQNAALKAAQDAREKGLAAAAEQRRPKEEDRRQQSESNPHLDAKLGWWSRNLPTWLGGDETARPLAEADAAYNTGDYEAALRIWQPLAAQGNASAQSHLGVMYRDGRGVPQDYKQAHTWFSLAAAQGNASALASRELVAARLAAARQLVDAEAAYNKGDHATALRIQRMLAEQGDAEAQFRLAGMYVFGSGVTQDPAAALSWYRMAAEQGHASAQINLGLRYARGLGVPEDHVQAYMWYSLAAAQERSDAAKHRDAVAAHMTAAQLAEAQRLARDWRSKPAK